MHQDHSPNGPRLHSCEDLEKIETPENDRNCLAILQQYTVEPLGQGKYATVVKMTHNLLLTAPGGVVSLAVKIISNDVQIAKREIVNACQVNQKIASIPWKDTETYQADTNANQIFCRTFGYLTCNGPAPMKWLSKYARQRKNWYLVTELGIGAVFKNAKLTHEDLISFVFEIIFSIGHAYETTGFRHKDLHLENVIRISAKDPNRNYSVASVSFHVNSLIYPKIIDFGQSTFEESNVQITFDVIMIALFLREVYYKNKKIDAWLEQLYNTARKDGATFVTILHSTLFESLRVSNSPRKKRPNMECHVCGQIANRVYEHAQSFAFCDQDNCVRRMGPIGKILSKRGHV
jgi:hypothetical protein